MRFLLLFEVRQVDRHNRIRFDFISCSLQEICIFREELLVLMLSLNLTEQLTLLVTSLK